MTEPTVAPESQVKADNNSTISIDDFAKVDLRVGKILSCEPVEGSSKLLKLEVSFGSLGKRQILSGIQKYFTSEELVGKLGIFVFNLAPRQMMGMQSQGMLLCAKDAQGNFRFLTASGEIAEGTRVS